MNIPCLECTGHRFDASGEPCKMCKGTGQESQVVICPMCKRAECPDCQVCHDCEADVGLGVCQTPVQFPDKFECKCVVDDPYPGEYEHCKGCPNETDHTS